MGVFVPFCRSFLWVSSFLFLLDAGIDEADSVSRKIRQAFVAHPNWKISENELRDLRQAVTFAIFAETEDVDHVVHLVDDLFTLLDKASRI